MPTRSTAASSTRRMLAFNRAMSVLLAASAAYMAAAG